MASYTNIFGGSPVQTADDSYLAINLTGNISLSWPTQFQDTNLVVAKIMDVTPDAGGHNITLPDARDVSVGTDFLIVNVGAASFNLLKNDTALLSAVASGNAIYFWLTDNSTAAGTWMAVPFGGGVAAVLSVRGTVGNVTDATNLTINGGANTGALSGAVALDFALAGDLRALTGFAANVGIAVRTAVNTWVLRSIVTPVVPLAGNLVITNPDGVLGDILIDLSPNIGTTGYNPITTMRVGNIGLGLTSAAAQNANTISSLDANGNITIDPNGAGETWSTKNFVIRGGSALNFFNEANDQFISLSAAGLTYTLNVLAWPVAAPATGQVLAYSGVPPAGTLIWSTATTFSGGASTDKAITRFNGTGGQIQNSGVILDDNNNLTGIAGISANGSGSAANSFRFYRFEITSDNVSNESILTTIASPLILSSATARIEIRSNLILGDATASLVNRTLNFQYAAFSVSLTPPVLGGNVPLILPAINPTGNDQIVKISAAGALSFSTLTAVAAVKADMQTPASILTPVVPAVVQYHPGVAKARGRFDATGVLGADPYNITAPVVHFGVGIFNITITTAMANMNYQVVSNINGAAGYSVVVITGNNTFTINTYDIAGALADLGASFVCYGTQ